VSAGGKIATCSGSVVELVQKQPAFLKSACGKAKRLQQNPDGKEKRDGSSVDREAVRSSWFQHCTICLLTCTVTLGNSVASSAGSPPRIARSKSRTASKGNTLRTTPPMRRPIFRKQHLFIGSGVIEAVMRDRHDSNSRGRSGLCAVPTMSRTRPGHPGQTNCLVPDYRAY
jgi:hypothetical protein